MKAPDKIYMLPEVASTVKVLDEEVEYIRKDALLYKLNRARNLRSKSSADNEGVAIIDSLIQIINQL